jgi:dipeptidase E
VKRLLLASHGIGALPQLVGGEVAGVRFGFVPTAAGPEAETYDWVRADRRQLEVLGCGVATLDLVAAGRSQVEEALSGLDGVFLTGGNAFLLLWHARRSGFAEAVVPLVESGRLLYVGTSAGGLIAGPDLEPWAAPANRAAVPELDSSTGLALVDFAVLPHDHEPGRRARHDALVAANPGRRAFRLTDDRAVLVRGPDVEVVGSPLLT